MKAGQYVLSNDKFGKISCHKAFKVVRNNNDGTVKLEGVSEPVKISHLEVIKN